MKVIDLHCDTISILKQHSKFCGNLLSNNLCVDLKRLIQSNYIMQVFAVFLDCRKYEVPFDESIETINYLKREVIKYSDYACLAYNYDDVIKNIQNRKLSIFISIEDCGIIGNDISLLDELYNQGVRIITLLWNNENSLGYSHEVCYPNGGLKPFGFRVIEKLENLGIIIDVSHLSDQGFYDVYNHTSKPFIASHSNARSITNHSRNLTDDMIRKVSKRRGLIGINFYDCFVNKGKTKEELYVYSNDLVKHIVHIKKVGGIECLALGSDFDGIEINNEIDGVEKIYLLYEELLKNGFTINDIECIFYKNVLAFLKRYKNS